MKKDAAKDGAAEKKDGADDKKDGEKKDDGKEESKDGEKGDDKEEKKAEKLKSEAKAKLDKVIEAYKALDEHLGDEFEAVEKALLD